MLSLFRTTVCTQQPLCYFLLSHWAEQNNGTTALAVMASACSNFHALLLLQILIFPVPTPVTQCVTYSISPHPPSHLFLISQCTHTCQCPTCNFSYLSYVFPVLCPLGLVCLSEPSDGLLHRAMWKGNARKGPDDESKSY